VRRHAAGRRSSTPMGRRCRHLAGLRHVERTEYRVYRQGRRPGIWNGLCAWLRIDEGDALGESLAFVIVEGHQHLVGFGLQVRAPNAEAEVGRLVGRGQEFSEDGGGDVLVAQQLLAQAHIDLDGARSLIWSQADDNKLDEAITLSLVDRCGYVGRSLRRRRRPWPARLRLPASEVSPSCSAARRVEQSEALSVEPFQPAPRPAAAAPRGRSPRA